MPQQDDRIHFEPQVRFSRAAQGDGATAFRQIMMRADIQTATIHAIAEMTRIGSTREELNGALLFIEMFQNFADPAPKTPTLPQKNLSQT